MTGSGREAGLLRPRWRTAAIVALGVLAVVAVRAVAVAAQQVLGWTLAAALAALFLTPLVRRLDVALPRALAIVVAIVALAATVVGVSWLYASAIRVEARRLHERAPAVAASVEERDDLLGRFAADVDLSEQVDRLTADLADGLGSGGDALRSAARSAPPYLVTTILTVFLVVYGGRIARGGLEQLAPERRARLEPALRGAARRSQRYVAAAVAQAVASGLAAFAAAALLGLPGPALLALAAAALSVLPYLGIALGWLPIVVLGLGTSSLAAVAAVAAVAAALQALEALAWRPRIDPRSLHVGPAIPAIVAVLGAAVYGIGGALCAVGVAVVALALVDELTGGGPLPTPLDDVGPADDRGPDRAHVRTPGPDRPRSAVVPRR